MSRTACGRTGGRRSCGIIYAALRGGNLSSERQVRLPERLAEGLVKCSVIGCEGIAVSRGALQRNVPHVASFAA